MAGDPAQSATGGRLHQANGHRQKLQQHQSRRSNISQQQQQQQQQNQHSTLYTLSLVRGISTTGSSDKAAPSALRVTISGPPGTVVTQRGHRLRIATSPHLGQHQPLLPSRPESPSSPQQPQPRDLEHQQSVRPILKMPGHSPQAPPTAPANGGAGLQPHVRFNMAGNSVHEYPNLAAPSTGPVAAGAGGSAENDLWFGEMCERMGLRQWQLQRQLQLRSDSNGAG